MKNQIKYFLNFMLALPFVGMAATNAVAKSAAPVATTNAVAKSDAPAAKQPVAQPVATNSVAKASVEDDEVASEETQPPQPSVADDPDFDRFKAIMERMPFGQEPANFNGDNPGNGERSSRGGDDKAGDMASEEEIKSEAEQQIAASVRVSAINVTPSGEIAVGFSDGTKQPSSSYYIKVGKEQDGWKVVEADTKELTVVLEKDGVSVTLKLGEGADNDKGAPKPAMAPAMAPGMAPGINGVARNMPGNRHVNGASRRSRGNAVSALEALRERRHRKEAERQAEAAQAKEAAAQAKEERAKAAAEREQQREALQQIREELRKQREAREQQQPDDSQAAAPDGI